MYSFHGQKSSIVMVFVPNQCYSLTDSDTSDSDGHHRTGPPPIRAARKYGLNGTAPAYRPIV